MSDDEVVYSSDEFDYSDSDADCDSQQNEYDPDLELDSPFAEEQKQKFPSPLKFQTHTTTELLDQMRSQSKNLEELFQLSTGQAITLLQYFSWNSEKLIEQYSCDPEKTFMNAGLKETGSNGNSKKRHEAGDFECMICCDYSTESYQLQCGHEFCVSCFSRYVEEKLIEGRIIKCPIPDCDTALSTDDIDNISGKGKGDQLLESSIKEFVDRKSNYKWCPSPDCNTLIAINNSSEIPTIVHENKVPFATCAKNHQFCVNCNFENHVPAPCPLTKKWITKCRDDSETVNWIVSNTKQCPKCQTSIEKNGGCNHMTCKKCRNEFCWICLGDWKLHGSQFYQCTRFDAEGLDKEQKRMRTEQEQKADLARRSLKRYMHFYNLFNVHDVSIKQDTARCTEVEDLVRKLQVESGISWIEAQFIVESATTLLEARRVLKWSNAIAYYCETDSYFRIFENIQAGLADAVEALSKLFEIEDAKEVVQAKLDFLNRQTFLIDRKNAMIGCVFDAIKNGTLNMYDLKG